MKSCNDLADRKEGLSSKFSFRTHVLIFLIFSSVMMLISSKSYLLFHSIIELLCIYVEFTVLLIALNTYRTSNSYYLFIGITFGFAGFFDLLHALSYKGIGIFPGDTTDLATQLWICARFLQSISFLTACFYIKRKPNMKYLLSFYFSVSLIMLVSIFWLKIFPTCYIDGIGLTTFKKASEVVICTTLLISMFFIRQGKNSLPLNLYKYMMIFLIIMMLSEISFMFYKDVYGVFNSLGHILKALAFYIVNIVFVEDSLRKPYNTLFYKLSDSYDKLIGEVLEREQVEKRLFESEEKYRILVEMMLDTVIMHDGSKVLYINRAGLDMLGYDNFNEINGMPLFGMVHKDYHNSVRNTISKNELGDTPLPTEKKYIRKDGRSVYIESTSTKILYKERPAYIVVARDISMRKQLEKERKLIEEAQEYEKLRMEFFSNISHEFRTPLNVILSAVQLMQSYGDEANSNKSLLNSTRKNCLRLLRITNNLIDISRVNTGLLKLNLENRNIVSVIEDITTEVANFIGGKGVEIIFDTEFEEKVVAIDTEKIERVMLNLLANALKFNKKDGQIFVNLFGSEGLTKITIEDTGVGIPEEYLKMIFEKFVQVNKSLTRDQEGSGLGLSIVKSLVELHGGSIYAESSQGRGSKFTIEIPDIILDDEVAVTIDAEVHDVDLRNRIEKINIEFSDVYL